jgi:hypothetical protein
VRRQCEDIALTFQVRARDNICNGIACWSQLRHGLRYRNGDATVMVNELVAGVGDTLLGCRDRS